MFTRDSPYWAIFAVCLGVFIAADDQTVVVTVLPSMMEDFRLGVNELDQVSWAVTGYLLGYTSVMPLMGRISDVHGYRRVYFLAMVIFMIGSVLVALSPNLPSLVTFRVFQAIGGGAVVPIGIAIVGDLFPPERRGVALGIIGASAEAGGVAGPLWGGLLDHVLDWRWVFWINAPLAAIVVALLFTLVPRGRRYPYKVDYRGGILLALVLAITTLSLSRWGDEPIQATSGLILGGVVLGAYVWSQRVSPTPLTPPSLFRSLTFVGANATQFLSGVALIIAMVNIPLITNTIMGQEPIEGGFRLARLTAAIPLGAVLGGIGTLKLGYRIPAVFGLLVSALGFYFMTGWDQSLADPAMTLHLVIAGLGLGMLIAPLGAAAINSVRSSDRGTAAGLFTVMRMVGMTVGLAAITSWGTTRFDDLVGHITVPFSDPDYGNELAQAGLTVFQGFFWAALAVCLLGLIVVPLLRRETVVDLSRFEA